MRKLILTALLAVALAVPAYALFDDNSTNANAASSAISSSSPVQNFTPTNRSDNSNDNRNTNTNITSSSARTDQTQGQLQGQMQGQGQIAAQGQGQGQLGIVSPTQSTSVGGDTQKNTAYVMTAPNTVAGAGQQAASVYSIFGGVNVAQTAEYITCREKMDVIENLKKGGYLTADEAQAEMAIAWKQFKDNTQEKRWLFIGPKTRGVNAGNIFGLFATDSCNEFNTDNWMGIKNIKLGKKK